MASKRKKRTITGLQRHGKKWRWRRTIDGESVSVPFSAPTEAAAIAQVLEFEKHPRLLTNDKVVSWLDDVNERNNANTRNNYQGDAQDRVAEEVIAEYRAALD